MVFRTLLRGLAPRQFLTVVLERSFQCPAFNTCWRHDELPALLSHEWRRHEPFGRGMSAAASLWAQPWDRLPRDKS